MPMLIEHIDKIARDKGRGVLLLHFSDVAFTIENVKKYRKAYRSYWLKYGHWEDDDGSKIHRQQQSFVIFDNGEDNPSRQNIIDWLDANQIEWNPCAHFASENGWCAYQGQIYLDFPFDESNEQYQKFANFIQEDDHGWSQVFEAVQWCYLPLDIAMENAHHDEPGFWDRWAENF